MITYEYGAADASVILLQMVDDHDLSVIESEVEAIRSQTEVPFRLIAVKVNSWNHDLSPWPAPAAFGDEAFGDGAAETLEEILTLCPESRICIIGGYSLAGLFALWASYQTDRFFAAAAASPSVWFPDFTEYMRNHECRSKAVYLSLGDKEEKTGNPVMAAVGDCIREGYEILAGQGVKSVLEWNKGNHFKEPDLRMARAFAWAVNETERLSLQRAKERVAFYEKIFDDVSAALQSEDACPDDLLSKTAMLENYYSSGEWRQDYEADEAGLFPENFKRGVLSQDGLYDLLEQWQMKKADVRRGKEERD